MRRRLLRLPPLIALIGLGAASPAGAAAAKLAYVTGNGANDLVWLADADGEHPVALGHGDQPRIAPSGRTVAASRFGSGGPALVLLGSGAAQTGFFELGKVSATAEAWSPDSRYLAVELVSQLPSAGDADSGLAVVDTQTNNVKMIAHGSVCGASFAPDFPAGLVYARGPAASFCLKRVNVFSAAADGSATRQLTHDGRSLNPVWGRRVIAFDRQTPRRHDAPIYQVWTMRPDGSHDRQITNLRVPSLLSGLAPLAFSADGSRLLAAYEGQDTSETWTIVIARRRARRLTLKGSDVLAAGISRDGRTVLVQAGPLGSSPSHGRVATLPFTGGRARILVKRAGQPSWTR